MIVGSYLAAVAHSRAGAFVALGGALVLLSTHVFVGLRHYRRVMNRPWPKVRPLDDWDD
jgi:hypothetical protein